MNFLHKTILLVAATFAVVNTANTQNLIPDPGFELWNVVYPATPNTLSSLNYWYNSNGTSDYHHQQHPPGSNLTSLEDCPTGEGNSECGTPYEGQGVLGCWKGNGADGSREWAGIKLSEPMVAGGCYKISFWVQNKKDDPDNEFKTNQWGLFFDHDRIPFFSPDIANYAAMSDHWVACEEVIAGSEWTKVELEYQASEDFEYAHIGYMGDYATANYSIAGDDPLLGFYVWIDEVIITRIDPQLTLNEDISICRGETVTLEAISNFPIYWEDDNSAGNSRILSPDTTTIYYVRTLDSTLCSIRDSIIVTIIDEEIFDFVGQSICVGADPLILEPNIASGTWSGQGIIDASEGLFDPDLAGAGEFFITYKSDADCSENFTIKVEVSPAPVIDLEADFLEGCAPLEVQFNDLSPTPGIAYQWNFGNGTVSDGFLNATTSYDEAGEYDVSLEVVFSENCKNTFYAQNLISVFDPPEANFTYSPFVPSNIMPTVHFENTTVGDVEEVIWNFGNGEISSSFNSVTTFDLPGIYDVQLLVTSSNNCIDSTTYQVSVNNLVNMYIPNAFSPNGDGINDKFEVDAIGQILEYEIIIFDRWGGVVYESDNIDGSWNGNLPGGEISATGVYAYLIKFVHQGLDSDLIINEKRTGDLTIFR
ncbi:T9SS type B sorting domain-containing protein [Neolewinella persica]|uniref:T9SS type B sorting domain-containing protein n=1 Tax=Neolewinella persica TaxID=70998 RepID=UPI00037E4B6E|nr:gliding motility-associated C-terminal domain-containing protein [Neolewinella persica]